MSLRLKIEIRQGKKRLLSFEAEGSRDAVRELNRFLGEKFPEVYEKLYGDKSNGEMKDG